MGVYFITYLGLTWVFWFVNVTILSANTHPGPTPPNRKDVLMGILTAFFICTLLYCMDKGLKNIIK